MDLAQPPRLVGVEAGGVGGEQVPGLLPLGSPSAHITLCRRSSRCRALGMNSAGYSHYGVAADDHHAAVVDATSGLCRAPGLFWYSLASACRKPSRRPSNTSCNNRASATSLRYRTAGQPLADAGGDHREGPDVVAGDLELVFCRFRLLPLLWWVSM